MRRRVGLGPAPAVMVLPTQDQMARLRELVPGTIGGRSISQTLESGDLRSALLSSPPTLPSSHPCHTFNYLSASPIFHLILASP
jgi:hypothetical protein